jgi:CRP/FNR family transcriptional regulator
LVACPPMKKNDLYNQQVEKHSQLAKCSLCSAKRFSICGKMDETQVKKVDSFKRTKNYKDKQPIFFQGDPVKSYFNVRSGNVKIYRLLDDGRMHIMGFLYPGDFMGLSSDQDTYLNSAEAIGNAEICSFAISEFDELNKNSPEITKELLKRNFQEIEFMQKQSIIIGKLHAKDRLMEFFKNISAQRKKIGLPDNPISLPMNRQDIADYLALTIETVSRGITELKNDQKIKMIDKNKLYIN